MPGRRLLSRSLLGTYSRLLPAWRALARPRLADLPLLLKSGGKLSGLKTAWAGGKGTVRPSGELTIRVRLVRRGVVISIVVARIVVGPGPDVIVHVRAGVNARVAIVSRIPPNP